MSQMLETRCLKSPTQHRERAANNDDHTWEHFLSARGGYGQRLFALPRSDDGPREQLEALAHSIESEGISSVEIFGVPEDALFAVNISPESLEKAWDYKLTFRFPGALQTRTKALKAAIHLANPQPSAKTVQFLDVRTGIVFYSKAESGKRKADFFDLF